MPEVKGSDIEFDYQAVGELLRTPEMEAEMRRRAENVREAAVANAPVGGDTDPHRGRYRDSFRVESGLEGFPGATKLNDRAWAMVENDAPEALWVEYGNRNIRARHTLLNALVEGAGD